MLELLRTMARALDGRITPAISMGTTASAPDIVHHLELLDDAGLAKWVHPTYCRITNAGHDFLAALDAARDAKAAFVERIGKGVPFDVAVRRTLGESA